MPIFLESGSVNLLEPSGTVQACTEIALPLPLPLSKVEKSDYLRVDMDVHNATVTPLFALRWLYEYQSEFPSPVTRNSPSHHKATFIQSGGQGHAVPSCRGKTSKLWCRLAIYSDMRHQVSFYDRKHMTCDLSRSKSRKELQFVSQWIPSMSFPIHHLHSTDAVDHTKFA